MRLITGIRFAIVTVFILMAAHVMPAAQVRLAWNAPLAMDEESGEYAPLTMDEESGELIAGYRVFLGSQSGQYTTSVDTGSERSIVLRDLDPHATYYIAVKAYDGQGVMSDASGEIEWVFDADANGLPDAWEDQFFGGTGEVSGGYGADFSGNGMSNGDAYIAGTDPTDPSDVPTLDVGRGPDGSARLMIRSRHASGAGYFGLRRRYAIEFTENLRTGNWHLLPGFEAIEATGHTLEIPVTAEPLLRFYRLRIRLETD